MPEDAPDKLLQRQQREAMRRGGPMDEVVSVPCEVCGKPRSVALRRFYHKNFPRCLDCGGRLSQEVAERLLRDRLVKAAQRLRSVLRAQNQYRSII